MLIFFKGDENLPTHGLFGIVSYFAFSCMYFYECS